MNTNDQNIILDIVSDYGVEIYTDKSIFSLLIENHFYNNVTLCRLLLHIIEEDATIIMYNTINLSDTDFTNRYYQLIDSLESRTNIIRDTLYPAINLLFYGLGIDCSSFPVDNSSSYSNSNSYDTSYNTDYETYNTPPPRRPAPPPPPRRPVPPPPPRRPAPPPPRRPSVGSIAGAVIGSAVVGAFIGGAPGRGVTRGPSMRAPTPKKGPTGPSPGIGGIRGPAGPGLGIGRGPGPKRGPGGPELGIGRGPSPKRGPGGPGRR